MTNPAYTSFLERKVDFVRSSGFDVPAGEINPICKPHQRDLIRWAVQGGRRAIFAKFGLGKSIMQLEAMRLVCKRAGGVGLIIAPLGVRQEFRRDAKLLGFELPFIRATEEITAPGLYLTNYESVREGKIDVSTLTAVSLDEASVLRGFGGTKTFREFMRLFAETPYRFVATATPSPNQYIEILAYSAFLGVMDIGEAKTRFFKRNSEKADQLTIHPHKEEEFWVWVHTWAVFLQRPSELGYSDEGYALPPLSVRWHAVKADVAPVDPNAADWSGQRSLMRETAMGSFGVQGAAAEKRSTLATRVEKVRSLIDERSEDHVIIWHDLEDERRAIESEIPYVTSVYGSQDLDDREDSIADFADGRIARLAAKPVMLGSGCNLQRHCAWAIYAGVGFKFNDFIQSIHRLYRFLQTREVVIDIIYAETETSVVRTLQEKWKRHDQMMERMAEIIAQYGLNSVAAQQRLVRSIGVERQEERGEYFTAVNNDCVEETASMASSSVDLILTSIPFGTQYEYTPSYNDFGHTDDDEHFFQQMNFLSPELLRVLKPGRIMAIHVKDRIRPGGLEGLGFQTVSPFHAECILHYRRQGFAYMGMITVVTDVVRENNQTYRLGWTEQCKDGSRMGVGMPEYVLLFRKPPTDSTDGYADDRVVKEKSDYTRARWQVDAHGFWRSNGNRFLNPDELIAAPADQIFKRFRDHSLSSIYDYPQDVVMLLQPQSWHEDVWTDEARWQSLRVLEHFTDRVTRMRTLNGAQYAKGKEMHLCPLQFDIVDRLIERYTNKGETVFDPFGGLGTVAYCALKLARRGVTIELSAAYHADAVCYLRAAEEALRVPTLFDLDPEVNAA